MSVTSNLGYSLQHIASALSRQCDQLLQARLGVGFSQVKILMVLDEQPHIQQRQIADNLGQTEASISRQIKLMIKDGLLRSNVNPSNRRVHIATPTQQGLQVLQNALQLLNQYHQPMLARLDDAERYQLAETLGTIHGWVCQSGKTGACNHPYS